MLFFGPSKDDPRLALLKQIPLFHTLAAKELKVVNIFLHERHYLKDEIVFDEGEEGQALFIVQSGSIRSIKKKNLLQTTTAEFGPGECFGELGLLESLPRLTQTKALEDSTLLAFFRKDFFGLLNSHSTVATKISLEMCRHLSMRLRQVIANT